MFGQILSDINSDKLGSGTEQTVGVAFQIHILFHISFEIRAN